MTGLLSTLLICPHWQKRSCPLNLMSSLNGMRHGALWSRKSTKDGCGRWCVDGQGRLLVSKLEIEANQLVLHCGNRSLTHTVKGFTLVICGKLIKKYCQMIGILLLEKKRVKPHIRKDGTTRYDNGVVDILVAHSLFQSSRCIISILLSGLSSNITFEWRQ